jgi:hypothetical protein
MNYVSIDAQVDAEQVGPGAKIAGNHSLQYPKSQTGCLIIMQIVIKYFVLLCQMSAIVTSLNCSSIVPYPHLEWIYPHPEWK